jgi:hypothetical protein
MLSVFAQVRIVTSDPQLADCDLARRVNYVKFRRMRHLVQQSGWG